MIKPQWFNTGRGPVYVTKVTDGNWYVCADQGDEQITQQELDAFLNYRQQIEGLTGVTVKAKIEELEAKATALDQEARGLRDMVQELDLDFLKQHGFTFRENPRCRGDAQLLKDGKLIASCRYDYDFTLVEKAFQMLGAESYENEDVGIILPEAV